MPGRLFAVLVHDHPQAFESLKRTMEDFFSIETYGVETCQEAENLIARCKAHIIFIESTLPDRSWLSILDVAKVTDLPPNSVVLGAILSGDRPLGMEPALNASQSSQVAHSRM